jgi:arylsulfatase A-like enzyme
VIRYRARDSLAGLCVFLLTLSLLAGCREDPPHIVVFLSDDVRWGHVGFQGGDATTPNLDRLAEEGVVLENFYVQTACTPTRASLLTGRYPFRTGSIVRFSKTGGMLEDERTLADALGEAGYYTAIVGKWHLGNWEKRFLPMQRGFDFQYRSYDGVLDYYTRSRGKRYDWHRNEQPLREEGYVTDLLGAEAVRVIENRPENQPLFLYVPFTAVHPPLSAPQELVDRYLPRYAGLDPAAATRNATLDAMLEVMDANIGKILRALAREDMRENTLVLFFNDNGGPGMDGNPPLRGGKSSYWEGGLRVPALVNWSGRLEPSRVSGLMHAIDWFPTLVKLGGGSLEQPLPLDGIDMWPTIAQGAPSPRTELVHSLEVLRQGDWKFIGAGATYHRWKAERDQLYNLADDPYESANLVAREPEIAARMRARLAEVQAGKRRTPEQHPMPKEALIYGEEEAKSFRGWNDEPIGPRGDAASKASGDVVE